MKNGNLIFPLVVAASVGVGIVWSLARNQNRRALSHLVHVCGKILIRIFTNSH